MNRWLDSLYYRCRTCRTKVVGATLVRRTVRLNPMGKPLTVTIVYCPSCAPADAIASEVAA